MLPLLLALVLALSFAPAAHAAEGEGVRVAVIDTGISTAAVDPGRINGGANYIRPQDDLEDKLGHGTAVSAIIVGSEPARVTGICPTATLIPMVFATKDGEGKQVRGDTAMVAQAIYDAIDAYHCNIINISSGSTGNSERLKEAVEYAEKKGVLVVSCAGNGQGTDPDAIYYPGGYESVICVGAANSDGTIASFSQQNDTVDLLALGTDLRLASVKGTRIRGEGTSFAAAIVTGAAAQIWTQYPELTAQQVREHLLSSTRVVDGWRVFDLDTALTRKPSPFSDVPADAYFVRPVRWAVDNGVTSGVTRTEFGPHRLCTQAHILTFLWKAAGGGQSDADNPYGHPAVQEGQYYYDPFLWAWEAGVVDDPALEPHAPCSRADVVTYLWRLAGRPAASLSGFEDVAEDAAYAQAVGWALEQGVTGGMTETTFGPSVVCTRAQIVTFLYAALQGKA